jgi:hypothetical protein
MVRLCIDRLPESYRAVLLLRDIEDLDIREVAAMLAVSPNACKPLREPVEIVKFAPPRLHEEVVDEKTHQNLRHPCLLINQIENWFNMLPNLHKAGVFPIHTSTQRFPRIQSSSAGGLVYSASVRASFRYR